MILKALDYLTSAAQPWVVYKTLVDLLEMDENSPEVKKARFEMLSHPLVQGIVDELQDWPGIVMNSHKSAGQLYHKLSFLADLGLNAEDPGMAAVIKKIKSRKSKEGLFQLPINIPKHFGGSGQEEWAWALCDAPVTLCSLVKLGLKEDKEIRKALEHLLKYARDNGWPCKVSENLGNFRGPGKKDDPCPYASLIMLKLLALFDEYIEGKEARSGVESLLGLWNKSKELHPYMFFMGTDFRKLKAPFIWYDILHVADVLSQYPYAIKDPRFLDMMEVVHSKADRNGFYTPESIWTAWKGWDFAQKKVPSPWLTFLVLRIDKRLGYHGGSYERCE